MKSVPEEQKGMGHDLRTHLLLKITWKQFSLNLSLKLVFRTTSDRSNHRERRKKQ
jgi:hypothetical protein